MTEEKNTKTTKSEEVVIGFENKSSPPKLKRSPARKNTSSSSGIPKNIANRMARRIAFTTGIPTLAGMGVFIGSYFVISRGIADISPTLTLVSSALCFLVGLLGLSYGILSASWDFSPGTFLGLENISPNINRIKDAFKNR